MSCVVSGYETEEEAEMFCRGEGECWGGLGRGWAGQGEAAGGGLGRVGRLRVGWAG